MVAKKKETSRKLPLLARHHPTVVEPLAMVVVQDAIRMERCIRGQMIHYSTGSASCLHRGVWVEPQVVLLPTTETKPIPKSSIRVSYKQSRIGPTALTEVVNHVYVQYKSSDAQREEENQCSCRITRNEFQHI